MSVKREQIDMFIKEEKPAFLSDYKKIVESPSVSCDPAHAADMQKTAEIAATLIRNAGGQAEIIPTGGHPFVWGRIENKAGAPTVAIYNHLDVQPAEKGKDGWTREPFTFTEHAGRFYSRGTTDDKGPALTALWAAKIAKQLQIPLNFEFYWEMEEEIGSAHFLDALKKIKDKTKPDSILVSDTIWLSEGKPAINRGLRGLMTAIIRFRAGEKDVHSGFAGGVVRNPLTELCELVSTCVDAKTGNIKVPGIEKLWKAASKEELAELVDSGFSVEKFQAAHKIEKMRYTTAADVISRIWTSPTFDVHGFSGGYTGPGVKTVICPSAEVKISMRLVGKMNPDEVFNVLKAHILNVNPDCEVTQGDGISAYYAPKDMPLFRLASEAIEFGYGKRPVFNIEGGSIGACITMDQFLEKPLVMLGISLPSDNYHGPDESFAWEQLEGGVRTFVKYFELLATSK